MKNVLPLVAIFLVFNYSCIKPPEPGVVINEIMPVNKTTAYDENGESDDWIELYNLTESTIDVSGYYLSDKPKNKRKWQIPEGVKILRRGYLIIWADSDMNQPGLHANFRLSSAGETVLLTTPDGYVINETQYPAQNLELTWARKPDGIGEFRWQSPTFNSTNNFAE
jgi:hypothetical protein